MEITGVHKDVDFDSFFEDYDDLINIYVKNDNGNIITPIDINWEKDVTEIIIGVERLNRIIAKVLNLNINQFLSLISGVTKTDELADKLGLSNEEINELAKVQLDEMVRMK